MALKPCLVPGCSNYTKASRCVHHAIPEYSYAERERMRAAVEAHRLHWGDRCPGYGVPSHPSTDLTADHVVPVSRGGTGSPLTVLCRACNSRKRDA